MANPGWRDGIFQVPDALIRSISSAGSSTLGQSPKSALFLVASASLPLRVQITGSFWGQVRLSAILTAQAASR
jgi:hypothetical protein